MIDYINRKKLIEKIKKEYYITVNDRLVSPNSIIENIINMIENASDIDTIKIGKCKDCHYSRQTEDTAFECGLWYDYAETEPDSFCTYFAPMKRKDKMAKYFIDCNNTIKEKNKKITNKSNPMKEIKVKPLPTKDIFGNLFEIIKKK